MKILLVLLLLISSSSYAKDDWDNESTVFQSIAVGMMVVDWGQTRDIVAHPNKHAESNPILGLHPTQFEVDRYYSTVIITHTIVSYLLPKSYRNVFQSGTIFVEFYAVSHNFGAGLVVNF